MSELKVASCFEFEKVLRGRSNKLFYSKSEVDAVLAEKDAKIHELENMPHTDNSAVIDALETENEALKKELAELREATRWRKCSEELPPKDGSYMCAYKNKNKDDGVLFVDEAVWDGEKWSYKFDFWEDIIYWQFKPKAPEDDK